MKIHHAMEFVGRQHRGVLATVRSSGLPQMSNVVYSTIDGAVWVSVTDDRAKTANLPQTSNANHNSSRIQRNRRVDVAHPA